MKLPPVLRQVQALPPLLLGGFGLAFALLIILGAVSNHNQQRQMAASDLVSHTYEVAMTLQATFSSLQDAESAQRAFVVSGNETYLQPYGGAVTRLPRQLDTLRRLTSDNPLQQSRLKTLSADVYQRLESIALRIEQRRGLGEAIFNSKLLDGAGVRLMEAVRADVDTMVAEENRLLKNRLRALDRVRTRSELLQTLGGLTSLALLAGVLAGLAGQIHRAIRAEQDARRSNAQLEDANAEMRAFSYSVAHDLRAPLRRIADFGQALAEDHAGQLDAEGRDTLGRITANAAQMDGLIDDLLALSRVSAQPLRADKVAMDELVRGVYRELAGSQGEGRTVECEIAPLPPAAGDSSLLRQVWLNLIENALKFTRGRERARIEIGGTVAGPDFATYYIRDNGAGFDMQNAGNLFGPFQRLHPPGEFEGTGIGLALVQRIVHRHGGTIWAEGTEGGGARFAFTLPEWAEG